MKKTRVVFLALLFFMTGKTSLLAESGKIKFSCAYETFPMEIFYNEDYYTRVVSTAPWPSPHVWWDYSTNVKTKEVQQEEKFEASTLMVRASMIKDFSLKNVYGGIEIGVGFPLKKWVKKCDIPRLLPTMTYFIDLGGLEWVLNEASEGSYTIEQTVVVAPLLGKLGYACPMGRVTLNFEGGAGIYLVSFYSRSIMERTYYLDYSGHGFDSTGDWKMGDEEKEEQSGSFLYCLPGGEFSMGATIKLSSAFSIDIFGRMAMLREEETLFYRENISYYQREWEPEDKELSTKKDGTVIGGTTLGGGVSINFAF